MKRVVVDASAAIPANAGGVLSGIGRTTLELVRELDSRQAELPFELVLFGQRLRRPIFESYGFSSKSQVLRLPRWNFVGTVTRSLPIVEWLTGADLFHGPSNHAPVCRLDRLVLTIHDAMFLSYPEAHLHNVHDTELTVAQARKCRAIITCSESSKRDIVQHIGVPEEKVHAIPWGYDKGRFYPERCWVSLRGRLKPILGNASPYFFSVSCDIGRKRSDVLLQQYLEFAKDGPANDLVLVWRSPPREVLAALEANPHSKRVHILRAVTDDQLRDLYCGATALLFPSVYEGFGLPVLEAMACGTPVVTTRAASLPEVGGDAPIYVSTDDSSELRDVMERFENGHVERVALAEKGVQRAAAFSWKQCADRTIDVYRRCLGI